MTSAGSSEFFFFSFLPYGGKIRFFWGLSLSVFLFFCSLTPCCSLSLTLSLSVYLCVCVCVGVCVCVCVWMNMFEENLNIFFLPESNKKSFNDFFGDRTLLRDFIPKKDCQLKISRVLDKKDHYWRSIR